MCFLKYFLCSLVFFSLNADISFSSLRESVRRSSTSVIGREEFLTYGKLYLESAGYQLRVGSWIGQSPSQDFYHFEVFNPFLQKEVLPINAEIIIFGDIHGSVCSLVEGLMGHVDDDFVLKSKDEYYVFLGDYVDRGPASIESLYVLFRLKCANPDRVFLLRGNHEDVNLNMYGFMQELCMKVRYDEQVFSLIAHTYETLASALIIGHSNDFILCCHGGLELGVDLTMLLQSDENHCYQAINAINRRSFFMDDENMYRQVTLHLPTCELVDFKPSAPSQKSYGFLWSDFCENEPYARWGRSLQYGYRLTSYYLHKVNNGNNRIRAIFRAHQHNGTMLERLVAHKGVASLWNNLVFTLIASSEPFVQAGEVFSSFVSVKVASDYAQWQMKKHVKIFTK